MVSEHIIKSYDQELQRLDNIISEMGGLSESQLAAAIEAVAKRDSELAVRVVEGGVGSGPVGERGGLLARARPLQAAQQER